MGMELERALAEWAIRVLEAKAGVAEEGHAPFRSGL